MGCESFDVVRLHLGPLLQGQIRVAKLKSAFSLLINEKCCFIVSLPAIQTKRRICVQCVYLFCLAKKKKKKLKDNGKVHSD